MPKSNQAWNPLQKFFALFVIAYSFFYIFPFPFKGSPLVFYKPATQERVVAKTWQMADVVRYFNTPNNDTSRISHLLELGLIKVHTQCPDSITIYAPSVLKDPEESISSIFAKGSVSRKAQSLCRYLYTSVPELYIDSANDYTMNYQVNEHNVYKLLQNLQQSKEAALCGQYATLTKTLLELHLPTGHGTIADVYDSPDVKFNHSICLYYYKENDKAFGIAVDAMYGYIFPSLNGEALPLYEISSKKTEMRNYISFLPDSILCQKRFLTDSIWPCNFLTENVYSYYKGLPGALKQYELHQAEDMRMLSMRSLDTAAYARGLYRALQKNKPEGY